MHDPEFEQRLREAVAAPFSGWDLSWLDDRCTVETDQHPKLIDRYERRAGEIVAHPALRNGEGPRHPATNTLVSQEGLAAKVLSRRFASQDAMGTVRRLRTGEKTSEIGASNNPTAAMSSAVRAPRASPNAPPSNAPAGTTPIGIVEITEGEEPEPMAEDLRIRCWLRTQQSTTGAWRIGSCVGSTLG
jgi:hypothetical protein